MIGPEASWSLILTLYRRIVWVTDYALLLIFHQLLDKKRLLNLEETRRRLSSPNSTWSAAASELKGSLPLTVPIIKMSGGEGWRSVSSFSGDDYMWLLKGRKL